MPKVSVLVPIYGVEKYIEKCVRSLFEQTLHDIQFVFVDDCTPDKSIEILNRLVEQYRELLLKDNKTVLVKKMPSNGGLAAVRKYGLQFCTGDFIVHCDSDDWVDVQMYEKLYMTAIATKSDLVFCDYKISDGTEKSVGYFRKNILDTSRKTMIERLLTSSDLNPVWSIFAKKTLYSNIVPAKGDMSEDNVLVVQLVYYAQSISYLQEALYYYRLSPSSIVRKNDELSVLKKFSQVIDNREVVLNFLDRYGLKITFEKALIAYLFDAKMRILPLIRQEKYYKIWLNTYEEINGKILCNSYITMKNKILYILLHNYFFRMYYTRKFKF